jgi:hypothetical protein
MFHSHRTLALAIDPGVVPNQKQGAKRVLTHINEAYQTSYTSKPRRKRLETNGCVDVYRILRVQRPLVYVTRDKTLFVERKNCDIEENKYGLNRQGSAQVESD